MAGAVSGLGVVVAGERDAHTRAIRFTIARVRNNRFSRQG